MFPALTCFLFTRVISPAVSCNGRRLLVALSARWRLQWRWHIVQMENKHLPQSSEETKRQGWRIFFGRACFFGKAHNCYRTNTIGIVWCCPYVVTDHEERWLVCALQGEVVQMLWVIRFQFTRTGFAVSMYAKLQSSLGLFFVMFQWHLAPINPSLSSGRRGGGGKGCIS